MNRALGGEGIENGLVCSCKECQSSEDEMEGETSHYRCSESWVRVRKMKGQSITIRLYLVLLTMRKTSQSSLSNSPVLRMRCSEPRQ